MEKESTYIGCHGLTKSFGSRRVIDDVTWEFQHGQFAGLLGASGAGKTTLLRILAGLERADTGEIDFGSRDRMPRIGMVFQELALWPHLSVLEHVTCVLTGCPRSERKKHAEQLLVEVELAPHLWSRRPAEISGGEGQRVAIARALASNPRVLLLDEPLARVDTDLRDTLLDLLQKIADERQLTTLYVSHAHREIETVCQTAAVMMAGRLVQRGSPSEIFSHPVSEEVARLTGPVVRLPGRFFEQGILCFRPSLGQPIAILKNEGDWLVRPQQIRLTAPNGNNQWHIVDRKVVSQGWRLVLKTDSQTLRFTCGQALPEGDEIVAVEVHDIDRV